MVLSFKNLFIALLDQLVEIRYILIDSFSVLQLSRKEIEEIYGTRHIGRDQARGLVGLMDFFSSSEVSLLFSYF